MHIFLLQRPRIYMPYLHIISLAVIIKVHGSGPLTWHHVVVTVAGGFGNPSSVTVPSRDTEIRR